MGEKRGKMFRKTWILLGILLLAICSTAYTQERIRLATTTSTDNSGLLEALLPPFEKRFGVRVDVIAVGTGKALKLGENGDVDAVLVHAREAEDRFVADGFGVNRRDVMYNDFVLAGPRTDPAGISGLPDVVAALIAISREGAPFLSRGDDSGTHKKEKALWRTAGITPDGSGYLESGQGMGPTLLIADEKRGYTLTDRGTFLAYRGKMELVVLSEGDRRLFNPYGIIAVNPDRHPHVRYVLVMALIGWVTSQEGQRIISGFTVGDEALFHPMAIR